MHFCRQNVASRIYALLSSNPPECQECGKGGFKLILQAWQCQDFMTFVYSNSSLKAPIGYFVGDQLDSISVASWEALQMVY